MGKKSKHVEFYALVGCEPDATPDQIKKAYRRSALRLHPDRGGDPEEFKKMKAAYDVISDPTKRKVYDKYGAQAIRAMDGEVPDPTELLNNLRRRDRVMLVAVISVVCGILLAFPIMLSYRWDAEGAGGKPPYSWLVAFVPLFALELASLVSFYSSTQQEPLNTSDMDLDDEARAMWRAQQNAINVMRASFTLSWTLLVLFQILVSLRLDGTIDMSWSLAMLPLTLLCAWVLATRVYYAPAEFARSDPQFHSPDEEQQQDKPASAYCTSSVFGKCGFWLSLFNGIKWSLATLLTSILIGVVADWNSGSRPTSFYIAAIPLLALIGLALLGGLVASCTAAPPQGADQAEEGGAEQAEQAQQAEQGGVVSVVIGWACSYGYVLMMVCLAASKLTDINAFSAFAIFSPVFFVVGCLCCTLSCVALTVTAEDVMEAEEQMRREAAGEAAGEAGEEAKATGEQTGAGGSGGSSSESAPIMAEDVNVMYGTVVESEQGDASDDQQGKGVEVTIT